MTNDWECFVLIRGMGSFTKRKRLNWDTSILSDKFKLFHIIALFFLLMPLISSPSQSQDLQSLLDRIERLERDIRSLNIQLARENSSVELSNDESAQEGSGKVPLSPSAIARFDTRMTSLEEDSRLVTGAMEEVDHRIRLIENNVDRLISDIDFRLSELEKVQNNLASMSSQTEANQQMAIAPATLPVTPDLGQGATGILGKISNEDLEKVMPAQTDEPNVVQSGDLGEEGQVKVQSEKSSSNSSQDNINSSGDIDSEQTTTLSPKEKYTQAFGLLRQAKYDEAATALQAFITQHPDEQLALNARYWLGETYYVRSEFVKAAEVFFQGYKNAPTGPKAPDTLLKLGMALGSLDKKVEACAAFTKLSSEFPDASSSIRATLERERLRNAC